jgi:hypothetical protein
MTDQPLDIQKISDLELAELLSQQMAQLFQLQANVTALQAELQRRKALLSE